MKIHRKGKKLWCVVLFWKKSYTGHNNLGCCLMAVMSKIRLDISGRGGGGGCNLCWWTKNGDWTPFAIWFAAWVFCAANCWCLNGAAAVRLPTGVAAASPAAFATVLKGGRWLSLVCARPCRFRNSCVAKLMSTPPPPSLTVSPPPSPLLAAELIRCCSASLDSCVSFRYFSAKEFISRLESGEGPSSLLLQTDWPGQAARGRKMEL